MKIEIIFLIVLLIIIIYQTCFCNKVTENFVDTITTVDLESIRNLGSIANKLMNGDSTSNSGVIVPGPMKVNGDMNITGDMNTSKKIKEDNNPLIPRGVIVVWYGTTIPNGWLLCDGTNNTPDLRNRFIYGAIGATTGTTGGSATSGFTLSTSQVPPHTHSLGGYNNHGFTNSCDNGSSVSCPDGWNWGNLTTDNGKVGSNNNGGSGTDPVSFSIMPPYYTLAYIMKI